MEAMTRNKEKELQETKQKKQNNEWKEKFPKYKKKKN